MSIPQSGGGLIEHYGQLAEYLNAGCKPKEDWKIGTEHEKFGYVKDSFAPLPYDGRCSIKAMLQGLRDTYNWSEILEGGNIIGLTKEGANVSLEPGGQLELSGAPLDSIHETCDEVNQHLSEVRDIADKIGAGFLGLGAAPEWSHEEMPMMPKGRYKLMTDYMDRVGTHGTQMMYRTCTVQVNLDFSSEEDMIKKMRVGLALQPVATALFANSPFFDGKLNNHKSWRSRVWRDLDQDRTGMLPFVFEQDFGFDAWTEYVLDVPMYFVYRDGKYIDALGQSFRDFLDGKLPALPGERPKISDWADHLTTVFPEAFAFLKISSEKIRRGQLSNDEFMNLVDTINKLDLDADWFGLREYKENTTYHVIRDKKPLTNETSIDHGVMVEVLKDGQFGYCGTSDLSFDGIQKLSLIHI